MPKEKFTAAFNAKVALAAIQEKETLSELAKEVFSSSFQNFSVEGRIA
jgi:hypothetical protein